MMIENTLSITIKHRLPGRLRLIFSHPPKEIARLHEDVSNHPGVEAIQYTNITRSLLITYSHKDVTYQEILVRVAMRFSLDYETAPVRIHTASRNHDLSDSAYYSGITILIALLSRLSNTSGSAPLYLNWGAGISTSFAVIDHAWSEYKEKGNFDPEVISFVYLINSMIRGTVLPAALLTWIASFGRHLLWPASENVELRPTRISQEGSELPQFELVIKHVDDDKIKVLSHFLRTAFGAFVTPHSEQKQSLLGQIREISESHGKVIEGLSNLDVGIPVHIR